MSSVEHGNLFANFLHHDESKYVYIYASTNSVLGTVPQTYYNNHFIFVTI